MFFYPKSFFVRLLICVAGAVIGTNIGIFVREVVIEHGTFVFEAMRCLVIPALVGAVAGVFWRQREA